MIHLSGPSLRLSWGELCVGGSSAIPTRSDSARVRRPSGRLPRCCLLPWGELGGICRVPCASRVDAERL
eukprot:6539752-Prymnesium_polylepis.1